MHVNCVTCDNNMKLMASGRDNNMKRGTRGRDNMKLMARGRDNNMKRGTRGRDNNMKLMARGA